MSLTVQMRRIRIVFTFLEIDFSESIIIRIDTSFSCTIKNRNTVIAANFNHGINDLFRIASFEVFAIPTGKEEYFRRRIFLDQSFTQNLHFIFETILHNICMKTLIVLIGPTGVGKTELSLRLAEHYQTCIVSADSRQLYADLKIGTAAPTPEQLQRVKHHLVGTLQLTDYYSAAQYEAEVLRLLET